MMVHGRMFINRNTALIRARAAARTGRGVTDFEITHVTHQGEQGYIVSLYNDAGQMVGVL